MIKKYMSLFFLILITAFLLVGCKPEVSIIPEITPTPTPTPAPTLQIVVTNYVYGVISYTAINTGDTPIIFDPSKIILSKELKMLEQDLRFEKISVREGIEIVWKEEVKLYKNEKFEGTIKLSNYNTGESSGKPEGDVIGTYAIFVDNIKLLNNRTFKITH